jgi:hypothetical protein
MKQQYKGRQMVEWVNPQTRVVERGEVIGRSGHLGCKVNVMPDGDTRIITMSSNKIKHI